MGERGIKLGLKFVLGCLVGCLIFREYFSGKLEYLLIMLIYKKETSSSSIYQKMLYLHRLSL